MNTIDQPFSFNPTTPIIAKRTIAYKDGVYDIYNIDKAFLPFDDVPSRAYRSAIVSDGKLMCLAPANSVSSDHYETIVSNMVLEPAYFLTRIVEGTMINLFWDSRRSVWEIATRRNIGGNCGYFHSETDKMTFRTMFLEALGINSLDDLSTDPDFVFLNEEYSYSFILQHPKNHLVLIINNPVAYLVHAYHIINSDGGAHYSYVKPDASWGNGRIQYAEEATATDVDNLNNPLNNVEFVGVMKVNVDTGLRTTTYAGKYLEVKSLRGNNPCLHYQYLTLRKVGKVDDFLRYFPQYKAEFQQFAEYFTRFKTRIHQLYMDVHVLKKTKVADIPVKRDKYYVEKLHHEVYLPGLTQFGKVFKVNKKVVEEFLDSENIMIPMGSE
jgi:hypothetical protein